MMHGREQLDVIPERLQPVVLICAARQAPIKSRQLALQIDVS